MDIRYFLEQKLDFIEQFYVRASEAFVETKRKIEAGEEPFIPPYSEDPDPPFLTEYIEAEESLQVIGGASISMLSASFHLYLKGWHAQLGAPTDLSYKWNAQQGWFNGYRVYFKARCNADFAKCPCNLELIEEITLARNRIQHPESITYKSVRYSRADFRKLQSPFFIDENDRHLLADMEERELTWFMAPTIHVDEEKLRTAVAEVSHFAKWLEETDH